MRILYLHQFFKTREAAGGTRSYELARHLVRSEVRRRELRNVMLLPGDGKASAAHLADRVLWLRDHPRADRRLRAQRAPAGRDGVFDRRILVERMRAVLEQAADAKPEAEPGRSRRAAGCPAQVT